METEGNGRIRLLHVDDHTSVVRPLSSRLEALGGYRVTVQRDVDAAIAALEESPYDCVLLADTVESTSAGEFCRRVRAAGLDCPILVLSSDPATAVSEGILDAGATDVVDTSSETFLRQLRQRIRLVVDTERGERAAPSINRLVADLPLGVFVEDETVSYANDAFLDLLGIEDEPGDRSLAALLDRPSSESLLDHPSSERPLDDADPQLVPPSPGSDDVGTLALWTDPTSPRADGVTVGALWDLDAGTGRLGEFQQRDAMLQSLLESLPLATSFRDAYGRYVAVSEQVTDLGPGAALTSPEGTAHHAPADLVGKTDYDLYPTALAEARLEEHEQVTETERALGDGGGSFSVGGEQVTLESVVAPWYDAAGNVVGSVDVTRDVTDRARSEHEAAVQREVFDVVGNALATELREAVGHLPGVGGARGDTDAVDDAHGGADAAGGIDSGADGADEANSGPDAVDGTDSGPDPVDRVSTVAEDLTTIVDAVRTARVDVEPTDLDAATLEAWQSVDGHEDSDCTLEVETDAVVLADPATLEQLLTETLENAVESGAETVRVGTRDLGFFVADDGCGIPPEERERVLEYGVTSKPDAVGSGLTVASLVATSHEWTLSIADSAAGGTRVEVDAVRFR